MNSERVKAGSFDLLMSVAIQAVLSLVFIVRPVVEKHIGMDEVIALSLDIALISMLYMIFRDVVDKSIGKKIMKLEIINVLTQNKAGIRKRFLRNFTWLLGPVEIFVYFFIGFRLGDRFASTDVIEMLPPKVQ